MRDVIGRMRWGMMGGGYAGRTTSPKSGRGVCRFLDRPPNPRRAGKRNGKRLANQKGMLILNLNC